MKRLPDLRAAIAVEPEPIKGSRITSFENENNSIHLLTNSIGNGAGCPILLADSAGNLHILFVNSRKSFLSIVESRFDNFLRENSHFEKKSIYS